MGPNLKSAGKSILKYLFDRGAAAASSLTAGLLLSLMSSQLEGCGAVGGITRSLDM